VSSDAKPGWKAFFLGLVVLAYVLLSLYVTRSAVDGSPFAATIAIVPILALAAFVSFRSRYRVLLLAACVAMAAAAWWSAEVIARHSIWIYFAEHCGGHLALAFAFGQSLRRTRTPVCTQIAASVHGQLEPALAVYTRQVTIAWTAYFGLTAVLSAVLFAADLMAWWSVFAGLLAIPLAASVFAVEYTVRLRRFPDIAHTGVFDGFRRYLRMVRSPAPPA
jgi:uncharacterized membrane protein